MTAMMGMGAGGGLWQEMLPGEDGQLVSHLVQNQYELVYGTWPDAYNEVMLVLDQNNELDDMTLYALGLLPKEDIDAFYRTLEKITQNISRLTGTRNLGEEST